MDSWGYFSLLNQWITESIYMNTLNRRKAGAGPSAILLLFGEMGEQP
jgi:hypothetical protein